MLLYGSYSTISSNTGKITTLKFSKIKSPKVHYINISYGDKQHLECPVKIYDFAKSIFDTQPPQFKGLCVKQSGICFSALNFISLTATCMLLSMPHCMYIQQFLNSSSLYNKRHFIFSNLLLLTCLLVLRKTTPLTMWLASQ